MADIGNIACGQTALANGPEYIALGIHATFNLVAVGRFFFEFRGRGGLALRHDSWLGIPPNIWNQYVDALATDDYRGLVYVVGDLPAAAGGFRIAVGFLHNLYTLEAQRVFVMGQIPAMLSRMGEDLLPPAPPIVARYIGGDFNVGPRNRRDAIAYYAGMAAAPPVIPGLPPCCPAFTPGGTLCSGHRYDYWFSNVGGGYAPPVPMTIETTLNAPAGMSDHCAIALQI